MLEESTNPDVKDVYDKLDAKPEQKKETAKRGRKVNGNGKAKEERTANQEAVVIQPDGRIAAAHAILNQSTTLYRGVPISPDTVFRDE